MTRLCFLARAEVHNSRRGKQAFVVRGEILWTALRRGLRSGWNAEFLEAGYSLVDPYTILLSHSLQVLGRHEADGGFQTSEEERADRTEMLWTVEFTDERICDLLMSI